MKRILLLVTIYQMVTSGLTAQQNFEGRKFEQLGTTLPTPNSYRTSDGSPGPDYWQQKVDYDIKVKLDEERLTIEGEELITYHNNSPNPLRYFWVQLDQNMRASNSDTYKTSTNKMSESMNKRNMTTILWTEGDLGYKILEVTDKAGNDLNYVINNTMMRVDLPKVVAGGEKYELNIKWKYNIHDRMKYGGRGGLEFFPEDGNYLFTITQWFPRMAVYDDINGWQNKQFLGSGEFALPFGDYHVEISVPSDHIIASTGELKNPEDVLSPEQMQLFEKSKTANKPVVIVSQDEVEEKEKTKSNNYTTWIYEAENVRDFAFGSSRKLIWDAMGVDINGKTVMAMSYYPKEANPLYGEYSTRVVAHTLQFYSDFTIPYPYPVAISVEARNGMEYPMICFNYGRPDKNGKYSERLKYGMISVVIHEVGHNFFPMIINSDERQWTWMDEGLDTFVQYLAEQAWEPGYPSRRGPAEKIVPYMKGSKENMVPVMTNSEQLKQFGSNAYAKPATALNILREVVMGPELFDYAFKQYSQKWAFKHPSPADFFRTMEDASAVDLDWFWKGWFYTTDNVDIELADVSWYKYNNEIKTEGDEDKKKGKTKNSKSEETAVMLTPEEKMQQYKSFKTVLGAETTRLTEDQNFYEVKLKNHGGLVMPVILQFNYEDGTSEIEKIPAEIWRKNEKEVTKVFVRNKKVTSIEIDPERKTADVNVSNNTFPPKAEDSKFDKFEKSNK